MPRASAEHMAKVLASYEKRVPAGRQLLPQDLAPLLTQSVVQAHFTSKNPVWLDVHVYALAAQDLAR